MGWVYLKWLAVLSMVVDHAAWVFDGPQWMHAVGRFALPAFALLVGMNVHRTRSRWRYAWRLLVWACVAQGPYMLAFGVVQFNILFTLAAAAALVALLMTVDYWARLEWWSGTLLVVACAFATDAGYVPVRLDGGWWTVVAVLLIANTYEPWLFRAALFVICMIVANSGLGVWMQVAAVGGCFACGELMRFGETQGTMKRFVRGWHWYAFYPGHLAVLAVLGSIL